ncbi:MAG TPA: flagellar protein FlaG [Candidatus Sumerlaeota bacterium]|nr:flagellar protein FlaG [Candidatus Sumerlaeota bacterium]
MYTTSLSGSGDTAPVARKRDLTASQVAASVRQPVSGQDAPEAILPLQQQSATPFFEDAVQVSPEGIALSAKGGSETQQQKSQNVQETETSAKQGIREALQAAEKRSTELSFSVDKDNGELIVKVVNKETGEVVREVPPEEIREMRKALAEMKGFLVKKTT